MTSSVELGFIEKCPAWMLRSKFFPSKIGGCPAWLSLNNLPGPSDLSCKYCKKPLTFLLQVYAEMDLEEAFHRTLYLFICRNGNCDQKLSNERFVVFRSQLPRRNEFYSFKPPNLDLEGEKSSRQPSAQQFQLLCAICGCKGALKCEKCSQVDYCCDDHRNCDWEWNHVHTCSAGKRGKKQRKPINNFNLLEFELVLEDEKLPQEAPEKTDGEKMEEYQQYLQSTSALKEFQEIPSGDLESVERRKDKAFNKFQKRVKIEPEQVLRYQRGGEPLWASSENVPSEEDIPNCPCGAKRQFEFQVMPQILHFLSLDTIDWGTLLVYTCTASCTAATEKYVKEFVWKQDFSNVSLSL